MLQNIYNDEIFLSYLTCNPIWLNIHVDHHHFDYIKKIDLENIASALCMIRLEPIHLAKVVHKCYVSMS